MLRGFLGKKIGMTQIYEAGGNVVPVTVIQAGPCFVTQIRTQEKDGYEAVQVGFDQVKKLNKPRAGHLKNSRMVRFLREVPADNSSELAVGQQINVDIFTPGELVEIVGRSKGRGFAGVVKRHGFAGGERTHGQSDRLRAPGSIGAGTTPGRVLKGMRMSGHMGNVQITVKNLKVVQVDPERNLLIVKGAVPGGPNSLLTVRKTGKVAAGS
ncbi:MAG TPA: 50S ribosomal protein L3 [Dehalococcoidia bacterium]|nr:50S ribosomal protein L3 [Dehalococcoidia bacterium]